MKTMDTKTLEMLYALCDMVNQFGYKTMYRSQDSITNGGLSALEGAFAVLEDTKLIQFNANGTIYRKRLHELMIKISNELTARYNKEFTD